MCYNLRMCIIFSDSTAWETIVSVMNGTTWTLTHEETIHQHHAETLPSSVQAHVRWTKSVVKQLYADMHIIQSEFQLLHFQHLVFQFSSQTLEQQSSFFLCKPSLSFLSMHVCVSFAIYFHPQLLWYLCCSSGHIHTLTTGRAHLEDGGVVLLCHDQDNASGITYH